MEIPQLMPFQQDPFNGDIYIQDKFLQLKKKFDIINAVETGSCLGGTTKFLCKHFMLVHTIEKNKLFYKIMLDFCEGFQNLNAVHGDSSKELKDIIDTIANPDKSIFFLDAHWEKECPLLEELQQIADAKIKPVIAIHDFKVPNEPNLQFDTYNGQPFDFDFIKAKIELIYANDYSIEYNTFFGASEIKRGIIYIYPKK